MAEVIGLSASAITLVSSALKSVQHLKAIFDDVKDAPKLLLDVRADLIAIEPALKSLEFARSNGDRRLPPTGIEQALENCARACQSCEKQIRRWRKNAKSDKLIWIDRVKIGLYGQKSINEVRATLNVCKATLTMNISVASRLAEIAAQTDQEDIAYDLQNQERKIVRWTSNAAQESNDIEKSIQHYSATSAAGHDEEERQNLLRELHTHKAANEAYQQACKDCMDSVQAERQEQKIGNIKATDHSQAIGGYYNAAPELQQKLADRAWNIGDITADGHSFAGGGVINNVDIRRG